jgi:hypothetical protein
MTLKTRDAKQMGKALFASRVTSARALDKNDFGTGCPEYCSPYITMAVALGSQKQDITLAVEKLKELLKK